MQSIILEQEPSMRPAIIHIKPVFARFRDESRRWQAAPSIEVTPGGRIFVSFISGVGIEAPGNFVSVSVSDDGGNSFLSSQLVAEHPNSEVRLYDPALWIDPLGRLWFCWSQARGFNDGRSGVWFSLIENPDAPIECLKFTPPRRLGNGIMLNKPTAISNGDWLFPCAIWSNASGTVPTEDHGLQNEQFSNVYASSDHGKTFRLRGCADVPNRSFDEHMVVEKKDGKLWMLVRCFDGIGESFSEDFGVTWTPGRKSDIDGPCSRFFIRRLRSGRLLLVNHYNFAERIDLKNILSQGNVKCWKGRVNLTALLSEDDGKTWPYSLLIDQRNDAAYPDAKEADDGYIHIAYDYQRVTHREILMAKLTESDIMNGSISSREGKLNILVNKATGRPDLE